MSRFEESLQLAQEKYLNTQQEVTENKPGEKTNQIFKEKGGSLFNEPEKKKPGIFTRMKDAATGAASKLSNMHNSCLLYTSPSPRDQRGSRMPSSA